MAVTSGNDLFLYNCDDGYLIGNYSFNSNVGCLTEHDGNLLNGDSSVIDTASGAYSYLCKLIECTNLNKLVALEITQYNYAYMGVAANGNDNHLIFYNYMVNDFASAYDGELLDTDFQSYFGNDALQKPKNSKPTQPTRYIPLQRLRD